MQKTVIIQIKKTHNRFNLFITLTISQTNFYLTHFFKFFTIIGTTTAPSTPNKPTHANITSPYTPNINNTLLSKKFAHIIYIPAHNYSYYQFTLKSSKIQSLLKKIVGVKTPTIIYQSCISTVSVFITHQYHTQIVTLLQAMIHH